MSGVEYNPRELESLAEHATYQGIANLLGCSFWQVYAYVKRNNVPTVKLVGAPTALVKLSDLAGLKVSGAGHVVRCG